MTRRGLFGVLLAPVVAPFVPRFIPKPRMGLSTLAIQQMNEFTLRYILPRATERIFEQSPLMYRLHGRSEFREYDDAPDFSISREWLG